MIYRENIFLLLILPALLSAPPLGAGTLVFSKPVKIATLPWAGESSPGVPSQGPDGIMVDAKKRLILVSESTLELYSLQGRFLQTLHPIDPAANFYGFTSMEILPDGSIALLASLESPLEQKNKDNFEERAKPGARLILVDPGGKVVLDKEELDSSQPHSQYFLEEGLVYSVHEDGTSETLDRLAEGSPRESRFNDFARFGFNSDRWLAHLRGLPVYHEESSVYHDLKDHPHENKGAIGYLLGRRYIENSGFVAAPGTRIYFQVVSDKDRQFTNAIFVEDLGKKSYGWVDLIPPEGDMDISHDHALYVDRQGDIYEGVAMKDGYRIYEWRNAR